MSGDFASILRNAFACFGLAFFKYRFCAAVYRIGVSLALRRARVRPPAVSMSLVAS